MSTHLALGVEYDGSRFHGWQWQKDRPSVQQVLEEALGHIAAAPVRIAASGRTDAGVHATGQVISFSVSAKRPVDAWLRGTNSLLPEGVAVRWVEPVAPGFHARFSATARRYMYLFLEQPQRPGLGHAYITWTRHRLDDESMHRGAQQLLGERDFSSFRGSGCQARTPNRCVHQITVRRFGALVVLDITANAFLMHMVRNIAGVLTEVGTGTRDPEWVGEVLSRRDRGAAARTAPANGLYLVNVSYGDLIQPPAPAAPLPLRGVTGLW